MSTITLTGKFIIVDPVPLEGQIITVFEPTENTVRLLKSNDEKFVRIHLSDVTGDWTNEKLVHITSTYTKRHEGKVLMIRITTTRNSGDVTDG